MTTRGRTVRRPGAVASRMPRPRYTWRTFDVASSNMSGGTNLVYSLATVGAAPDLGDLGIFGDYTIRRVHLTLAMVSNVAATGILDIVYWGMTVVSSDALAQGAASLPDARLDSADWFGHGVVAVLTATSIADRLMVTTHVDVKSMRKVNENNQDPAIVFSSISGDDVTLRFGGRMLVSHGRQ